VVVVDELPFRVGLAELLVEPLVLLGAGADLLVRVEEKNSALP